MGFLAKHVIRVHEAGPRLVTETRKLIDAVVTVTNNYWTVEDFHSDFRCMDDRNWNSGYGSKWRDFHKDAKTISQQLPDSYIYFWYESEDGFEVEFILKNGKLDSYNVIRDWRYSYHDYEEPTQQEIHKDDFGCLTKQSLKGFYVCNEFRD